MKEKEKKKRINSKKRSGELKNRCNSSITKEKDNAKRAWSDVFDKLTYSNGPGDNIYVFG